MKRKNTLLNDYPWVTTMEVGDGYFVPKISMIRANSLLSRIRTFDRLKKWSVRTEPEKGAWIRRIA